MKPEVPRLQQVQTRHVPLKKKKRMALLLRLLLLPLLTLPLLLLPQLKKKLLPLLLRCLR